MRSIIPQSVSALDSGYDNIDKVSTFILKHKQKIQEIGVGIFLYEAFNQVYNFIFYPLALAYWGLLNGGIIVVGLSFVINIAVFWLYEFMRIDWLGAHALRELDNEANKSSLAKIATWLGKEKTSAWEKLMGPVIFVLLLLPVDPVIVAIHYQRQHFKGLGWRDWGLLLLATAIGNAWWLIKIGAIVEGLKYLLGIFF